MSREDPRFCVRPWKRLEDGGAPLKIGFIRSDPYFPSSPPCARAVDEAVAALESAGHELVDASTLLPCMEEAFAIYVSLLTAYGGMADIIKAMEGEDVWPTYSGMLQIAGVPRFARPSISFVLRLMGENRKSKLVIQARQKTAAEYWEAVYVYATFTRSMVVVEG